MTAKTTVKGVATTSPTGPQSQVQKTTAIRIAAEETPMPDPYRIGSSTLFERSSRPRNRPSVASGACQPGETDRESRIGRIAAIHGPR